MYIDPRALSGPACCRRYQKDYIARANARSESATLECIKFYADGKIRFEQHCYGEAASCIFTLWAKDMDAQGNLQWDLPAKGYYDAAVLPAALERIDENGWLYFTGDPRPWKPAADLEADPAAGYPRWKVLLHRITHH